MAKPGTRAELAAGWRLILAAAAGVGFSAIALPFYALGPLAPAIAADTGWARADILVAIAFSSGLGALMAPAVGWGLDRFGPRRIAIPATIGVAAGLGVAAAAGSLPAFWAGFALTAILGAGTSPVLWSRVIAGAFAEARGLALGLALAGTAAAAILLPQLVAALEPKLGWRGTLGALALLPLVAAFPVVAAWLHPSDRAPAAAGGLAGTAVAYGGLTLGEAVRDGRFWLVGSSILATYVALSGTLVNLVPAMADRGIGAGTAAALASIVGAAMRPGRILAGALLDRLWAPGVGAALLAAAAVAAWQLGSASEPERLFPAAAGLGLAAGAELDLMAFLTARHFGLAHCGRIYGLLYGALATGSALAPSLFARLVAAAGVESAFLASAVLFLAGAILLPLLGPYPDHGEEAGPHPPRRSAGRAPAAPSIDLHVQR